MMELFANLSVINCTSVLGHLKLEAERAQIKISITQQANISEKVKKILNATCYIILHDTWQQVDHEHHTAATAFYWLFKCDFFLLYIKLWEK